MSTRSQTQRAAERGRRFAFLIAPAPFPLGRAMTLPGPRETEFAHEKRLRLAG